MTGGQLLSWLITGISAAVILYFLLLNAAYLFTTMMSLTTLRRHARRARAVETADVLSAGAPPVTLLAPAYNEEATCVEATTALLSLVYPEYEVIVINDGSKDGTIARLTAAFELEAAPRAPTSDIPSAPVRAVYRSTRRPNLWVIDKENGGKADALNVGIKYCRTELFCAMDADTLLERDALARVVRPFLEDGRTVAAGGIIRIVNDSVVRIGMVEEVRMPRNWLARFQVLEYLRAFLAGRVGWDALDAMLIISGAFGVFRRSLVVQLGGYATDTVGEDMELVVRIHRHCLENDIPYRVTFVPDPVAWTECPETLRVLGRQRDRWQRGLMQVLWRHQAMMFRPRFGRVGMMAFPYFYFLEGWGPVIEIAGYLVFALALLTGQWSPLYAAAFFAVAFVFGAALSIAAVGLEELSFRRYERKRDLAGLLALSALEPFGYRQLSSWWRARGLWSALRGVQGWGAMERRGFVAKSAVMLALAGAPATLHGQEMPWTARASVSRDWFASHDPAWSAWHAYESSVGRRFPGGALSLGGVATRRFDLSDRAVVVDAYGELWRRGYGNVRVSWSPTREVMPRRDVAVEVYQGLGAGWEPSIGYRRMRFHDATADIISATLARYVGDWYARGRMSHSRRETGASSAALSALLRRYLSDPSTFVELGAGSGGELVTVGVQPAPAAGPRLDVRRTTFVAAGGQRYLTRHVGGTATLTYTAFERIPARTGVTVGALVRW